MLLLETLLVVPSKSVRDFVRMKFGEMSASAITMAKLRLLEKVWWRNQEDDRILCLQDDA